MPDQPPDDSKRQDRKRDDSKRDETKRDEAKRDDAEREDQRPGRPDRRPRGERQPERGDEDRSDRERLARWVAQLDEFAAIAERTRRAGLAATDAADEHADRALGERRRAEQVAAGNDAATEAAQRARAAAENAARQRAAAEGAYKQLVARIDDLTAARKAFDAAVERRDQKAAQAAGAAADAATDTVADALDPIIDARDAAAGAADAATEAADAAAAAAAEAAREQDEEARRRFEEWTKRLEFHETNARDNRASALADVEAAEADAGRAAEEAKRASGARPSSPDVEQAAARADEAAARARSALERARRSLAELRKRLEAIAQARKNFDAAVAERDRERALDALDAAERSGDQLHDTLDPIAQARKEAADAAEQARRAADRAEAAAAERDQEDEQEREQVEANAEAVERAGAAASALADQLEGVVGAAGEIPTLENVENQLAKGERCAERAQRSPVQGPVARAALAEAREQAATATAVRREIDAVLARLERLVGEVREAADKATAIHDADPGNSDVLELAEFVKRGRDEFERLVEQLKALIERLRGHLQAIRDAIEAACDAARLVRLENPQPSGGDSVLRPPRPQPVPDLGPPDPGPDPDPDPDPDEDGPPAGQVPLLLVPVRIETRFGQPGDKTTPLRIRIYPDRISVADDRSTPSELEVELARQYWSAHVEARADDEADERDESTDDIGVGAAQDAAWSWLVDQLDIHRAGYLARLTRPTRRDGRLVWPDVETTDVGRPSEVRNLPRRFVAIGWSNGVEVFRERGAALDGRPYHTSPDPRAEAAERTDLGITVTEHMRWMVDYDDALERGMAITVDVEHAWGSIDTLIVVGIDRRDGSATAEALTSLLDTHAISQGFAFVPQGTPTNNTDTVDAGWTRRQRERDVVAEQRRVDLTGKLDVAGGSNVARFARALGLSDPGRLARQPFALDGEWARGAAMRAGLYDVVIGHYLQELLPTPGTAVLTDPAHEEFRAWFVDHVTGGAAVPTIRVGPQPYAVLPVLRPGNSDVRPSIGHRVARVVRRLKDEWLRTLDDGVARLDHNVGEDPDAVRGNIADVLAAEPHPADLVVRRLDLHERTSSQFDELAMGLLIDFQNGQPATAGEFTWVDIDNGFIGEFEFDLEHIQTTAPDLWAELVAMRSELGVPETVEEQLVLWSKFRQLVEAVARNPWGEAAEANVWIRGQLRAAADVLQEVNDVVAGLAAHEQRQRPLSTMMIPDFNGVLGEDNPPLIVSKFAATAEPVERPLVADDTFAPADYVGPAIRGQAIAALDRAPLLAQLLSSAASSRKLPDPLRGRAITALSQATDEELEWTLRETLGLGIHRLDAWHTAFANQELEAVRSRRPEGLHVGSYAWVTDLEIPDRQVERASRGFLHAPSLGHAVTASVIRSAWHARGDADGRSPAAVDLRGNRYRYAKWLIEGVRAGQTLGDLLGYEFERLCHDLGIDEQIARIRVLVGEAHDRNDGIEDPVDGIELMELFDSGGVDAHLAAVRSEFGAAREETLRLLLEGLAWSFDAVDDALLAESTHHLLGGNFERAAASIEAGSGGTAPPPMPIGMDTTRPVRTVNHKVLLLADATSSAASGWGVGVRDRISPPVDALASSLLPAPQEVALTLVDAAGSVHAFDLAELELSALDAVYLASDDPTMVDTPLATIVRIATGIDGTVDTSLDPGGAGITLEEFQVVARSVRRMLSEARIASSEDLDSQLVGAAAASGQLTDADTLLADLATKLAAPIVPGDDEQRRRFALAGITGTDGEIGQVATRRIEAARALGAAVGRDIVGAAFGRPFPVAAPIDVQQSGASFDPSLADHGEVMAWLDDVALVRADVDRLVTTMNLGAMVGVAGMLTAGTSQSPRNAADAWAATGLPAEGTGGRNVVTAVWPGASSTPPAQVVALVIDQWSEQIPGTSTVTGVAMHYDAPSQRPPQAMVLGVPETDEPWTIDGAISLLLDAMEWMQLRAVAPEDLGDYGHTIPTVFSDAALFVDELPDEEDTP